MAFQDEACRWRSRVHLGKVRAPILAGIACVAALIVVVVGVGVAQALTTEGFVVAKSEETTAQASDAGGASASVEEQPSAQVCVFVSGEVARPAIYYLDEGSRVADAITAAGGFTDDAATDALNLARTLIDGEQVAVPAQGSAEPGAQTAVQPDAATAASASGAAQANGARVNINTADAAALQTLNGIGEATAKKIVADREANGPYKTIEDLKRVSGIGDKKFENLRDSICA